MCHHYSFREPPTQIGKGISVWIPTKTAKEPGKMTQGQLSLVIQPSPGEQEGHLMNCPLTLVIVLDQYSLEVGENQKLGVP